MLPVCGSPTTFSHTLQLLLQIVATVKMDVASHWILSHPYELRGTLNSNFFAQKTQRNLHRRVALQDNAEYDVIVVGGGTAGCVLASRLSEDPSTRVCLIEFGGSSLSVPNSRMSRAYSKLFGSEHDFNFTTIPQSNASSKTCYWPREPDWNIINRIQEKRSEDAPPSTLKYSTAAPLPATTSGLPPDLLGQVLGRIRTSASELLATIPLIRNCGHLLLRAAEVNRVRISYPRSSGTRQSSRFDADFRDQVVGDVRVTAVEVSTDKGCTYKQIKARREVVLCITFQILMLSGLDPAEQLRAHGIPVVVDLLGVGAHLMDHPCVDVVLEETTDAGLTYLAPRSPIQLLKLVFAVVQYLTTGRGLSSSNWAEAATFFRFKDLALFPPSEYSQVIKDTASGPDAPDLEVLGRVRPAPCSSASLSSVTLHSADPFQAPVVDPNARLAVLTECIRANLESLYHPTSTARMAPRAAGGVVDAQLRVYGIKNLRTADASVFPTIPAGHTVCSIRVSFRIIVIDDVFGTPAAPTVAVAEKAADMMKVAKYKTPMKDHVS
ncbi:hypothetical protein B0H13DRAFT_2463717 [Mycena leptocephala]|nr:hypothetical protein B0H13DRAFT_2463717 [Mycena leptocephala]